MSSFKFNSPHLQVSEAPFWSNGSLYYVDMIGRTLHRYSYDEDRVFTTKVVDNTGYAGFLLPIQNRRNRFIAGFGRRATIINWDGVSPTATKERDLFAVPPHTNLNGLLVSPENDLYTGNYADNLCYAPPHQSVFGYLRNGQFGTLSTDFGSTVGMVLIEATNTVYHVDSCKSAIVSFKWNRHTGQLCTEQFFHRYSCNTNYIKEIHFYNCFCFQLINGWS